MPAVPLLMNIAFVLQILLPSRSIEVKSRVERYNPPFPNVLCNISLWHLFTNLLTTSNKWATTLYNHVTFYVWYKNKHDCQTTRTFSLENFVKNWVLNRTKLSTIILFKITLVEAIFFSSNTDNICKPFNHKSVYSILIYSYAVIIKRITLKYVELPLHLKGYQTGSPITWKRMIN